MLRAYTRAIEQLARNIGKRPGAGDASPDACAEPKAYAGADVVADS